MHNHKVQVKAEGTSTNLQHVQHKKLPIPTDRKDKRKGENMICK